ncbi:PREDICTED: putative WEB family protein At1g65010, chloroplastic [Nicotiana attenuata]|uniref:Web family protein, chloroplastic n=1 Tax=Nicotiana attenuata TaxID=49451 RepID=A0A314KVG8_NICAT|nr:PREDICTED: putative WEB family protein At1g65010, chloroplastic [Nicotiana attenuata]OIT33205.1 putative web family protein, chloroplastic [Nicotiana attenuata]
MLRSKSRSGANDIGQRSHSSRFSRAISATKLCRGDALGCQIDSNALVSLERKSVDHLSENRVNKILLMQEQMGHLEEELKETKEQLNFVEGEKNRAIHELKEMRQVANEANKKLNEGLSPKKAGELIAELKALKELNSKTQEELKIKDKNIESLRMELERVKKYEVKLAEKDAMLGGLREEMNHVKATEVQATEQLSVFKKKVKELEVELEQRKLSESKIYDSFESQTRQFEQAKIELEESKLEMASLREKVESLETSSKKNSGRLNGFSNGEIANSVKKELESLNYELALAKEDVANAQEREKIALSKAKNLNDEISLLKNEVKLASEAEEKSRKAMDDLALALKEVATEASEAKEKLSATQLELEQVKEEAGKLKEMVRNTEARYQKLLDEAKKETDLYRNTADRLRLETEESLLAWNGKEMGFITCIKRAEEERTLAQRETERLAESLKAAEDTTKAAKEEKYKLRDILKQAINEANAAKAAAGLARDENSQLKDRLAEKEEALHFLSRENERLRTNTPAAHETVNEFKRLPPSSSTEFRTKEMVEEHIEDHNIKKSFSADLRELKLRKVDDSEKDETLKGSIFDPTSVTPKSEPHTPHSLSHRRRASSPALADDAGKPNTNPDFNHSDESDSDKNSSSRRKALFRKVGDLIMRKSFHI